MKNSTWYVCDICSAKFRQWQGKCTVCNNFGTLSPIQQEDAAVSGTNEIQNLTPELLEEISLDQHRIFTTGSNTIDSLLGQGMVPGSTILLGGEPGVGKSTFLLQLLGGISKTGKKGVYISGEETLAQLKQRAGRLNVLGPGVYALHATRMEEILHLFKQGDPPALIVVDSVQTLISDQISGGAGSISQVKYVVSCLLEEVKKADVTLVLVGHVTKEGHIAGPKLVEHMVDTVLYLEGDENNSYRILRVVKNRFGPTSHILVLNMLETGLEIVHDPSTFFLQARNPELSGTALVMALEGQRPFVVEVQALVSKSYLNIPRRTALGFDTNRLHLLLALLEKKLKLGLGEMDIYAKIGGGLKLEEPSLDLGVVAAVLSSYYDKPLKERSIYWGEVDLSGQVRPVAGQDLRYRQARNLKYSPVLCPASSTKKSRDKKNREDIWEVSTVFELQQLLYSSND